MDPSETEDHPQDFALMRRAIARANHSRLLAPPNPWVGSVVVATDGTSFEGGTQRPGLRHAERLALDNAGDRAHGGTLYTTLEPCSHHGRTGPCSDAIIDAGIARVVVGLQDPDPKVAGTGIAQLREAGIEIRLGVEADAIADQLKPYLHHRRTGRPYVVLKLAATLDGQTAAADGSSQWITGPEARADAHLLRAQSDAILVGAATVRTDDPQLTVRGVLASDGKPPREPVRIVLGKAPAEAKIWPCLEMSGELTTILDELGSKEVIQLMVEGGATVAGEMHRQGLVDSYVLYLAPALMGGTDGTPLLAGVGAPSIGEVFRGQIIRHSLVGKDLRIEVAK